MQQQLRLITLGRLALITPEGEEDDLGKRRRKLALLAVLALSPRPLSRDTLVDMFWGEESEERARHSLSDALSHLRRVLGKDAISARQADIELSAGTSLVVDARAFSEACRRGDWDQAIAEYGGPFLDGVIVDRSPRFEHWAASRREELQRQFVKACATRCEELARSRDWKHCGDIAGRWLDAVPASVDATLYLLNAQKAAGTPDALRDALATYDRVARRLHSEFDTQPHKSVVELAERIKDSLAEMSRAEVSPRAETPPFTREPERSPQPHRPRVAVSPKSVALTALAIVSVAAIGWAIATSARASSDAPPRTVVAVTTIQNTLGDTSAAWLGEGLRQMLASGLDRSARLEVVPPARVRDAIVRRGGGATEGDELRVARELGATWAVRGGLTRGEGVLVLDITVTEAATGNPLNTFSVTGQELIGVADQAVSRIRAMAAENAPGPRFSDIETANVDAFQYFVRAQQAGWEGRFKEVVRNLDAAIALDSAFTSAIMARLRLERGNPRSPSVVRLAALYERASPRLTDWDRLEQATYHAFHNGEHGRADQLARTLVARYPHDPRAYTTLADVLGHQGRWAAADSVYQRLLSLDSLAIASGDGPCVPCGAFGGLISVRVVAGDLDGAERAARRWIALQPDLPSAWTDLASVLAFSGRFDAALDAQRRAVTLSNGEPEYLTRAGRILIMARRFSEADSAIAAMARRGAELAEGVFDLRVMLHRERGQHRAALALMEMDRRRSGGVGAGMTELLSAQTHAMLGRADVAVARYEAAGHSAADEPVSPVMSIAGDLARAHSWHHALEADAVRETTDTIRLRALADTLERLSVRSYYGRDWRLHHHIRGLVAARGGRHEEAMRELSQARWGVSGWTRTLAAYADAALAANRPAQAIDALRDAYKAPLDAMGRYLPRTEIDFRMALAFEALGARDSALVYSGHVRSAWQSADPEWKRRLAELP